MIRAHQYVERLKSKEEQWHAQIESFKQKVEQDQEYQDLSEEVRQLEAEFKDVMEKTECLEHVSASNWEQRSFQTEMACQSLKDNIHTVARELNSRK